MMKNSLNVHVRSVWAGNVDYEFSLIRSLVKQYPFVAIDTEFPGIVFKSKTNPRCLSLEKRYALLKMNVDSLCLIQVGLTLSDADGQLPDLGTNGGTHFIWEFNFRNFDLRRHAHNAESIKMLQEQGINFAALRTHGVDFRHFRRLILSSGLLYNPKVTWITFHSSSDFAYVMKTLTGIDLPMQMKDFLLVLKHFFGPRIYDMKHMIKFCNGLYGGLESVAAQLRVERIVGRRHQAGSDSLLMLQIFMRMKQVYFATNDALMEKHMGVIYDLELEDSTVRPVVATALVEGPLEAIFCGVSPLEVGFCGATNPTSAENIFAQQLPGHMTQQLPLPPCHMAQQTPIPSFPWPYYFASPF
ncbi:putative CCR4-associated factor 11 [Ananas comosus]|uniref:poly(A)-specific ribonuclease n=1 Tax=Ananas comosus TaxID=4615 RepID=A0A199W6R6_ANACO|nr:putative CCR4-associated factor 11 [Ananas comosus]